MDNNFNRVFSGETNLYEKNSPIIISATALTKDNRDDSIFAQIKIQNVGLKTILAIIVSFDLYDVKNNFIESVSDYQYLDLHIGKGEFSGGKTPIFIQNNTARSLKIVSIETIFDDGESWKCEDVANWECIPDQHKLNSTINDTELDMLQESYDKYGEFFPFYYKDLYFCSCGTINKANVDYCYKCNHELKAKEDCKKETIIKDIYYQVGKSLISQVSKESNKEAITFFEKSGNYKDAESLIKECNNINKAITEEEERIKKEKIEKERLRIEKIDNRKKEIKKALMIATPSIGAIVAIILLVCFLILPSANYKKATTLLESGDYSAAINLFSKYPSFKDSTSLLNESKENLANNLLNQEKYDEAYTIFEEIGKHETVKKSIEERANALLNEEKYDEAYSLFTKAENKSAIIKSKYSRAEKLINDKKYDEAETLLGDIKDDSKASELLNSIPLTKIRSSLSNVKKGDSILFGEYEQDNYNSNGKEKIEWIVLEKSNNKILVISKYALSFKRQNTSYSSVDWENCELRNWLNNSFYNDSFSDIEKSFINSTKITKDTNSNYNIDYGRSTIDKVFILSLSEAQKYLSNNNILCYPTPYAVTQTQWYNNTDYPVYWWVRAPVGYVIDEYGTFCVGGLYAGSYSGNGFYTLEPDAVRPAMWINIEGKATTGEKYYYVTTEESDLNVRAEKSTTSDVVARIPKDSLIKIDEIDGNWAKITYKKKKGYVSMDYLRRAT